MSRPRRKLVSDCGYVGKACGVLIMFSANLKHALVVYCPWAVGVGVLFTLAFMGYEEIFYLIF